MSTHAEGSRTWSFAAGNIPAVSTGHEPEYTSRDELCLLNTGPREACVEVMVFHSDRDPVGPYRIAVAARRVRQVRVNDLIDPEAVPLGVPYGLALHSDEPVVAQLRHVDTSQAELGVSVLSGVPGGA